MPQKDRYHDTVVRALEKDGWLILKQQVLLTLSRRHLWIDLKAQRNNQTIYVEIKGFETEYSPVDYLATAVGQCVMYQAVLDRLSLNHSLYLAAPIHATEGILGEELGKTVIHRASLQLIIFDVGKEEIVRWETPA